MSLVILLAVLIVLALPVLFFVGCWYGIQYAPARATTPKPHTQRSRSRSWTKSEATEDTP